MAEPTAPKERKFYGKNACLALFERRAKDVIRVYVTERVMREVRPIIEYCVNHRLAYHVVDAGELEAVSGSRHHEGICVLARVHANSLQDILPHLPPGACLLALDRVENPHNLGAILRSAAHFGAEAVVVAEDDAELTGAALRTAEGGAEFVEVVRVPSLTAALETLSNAGYRVVATAGNARRTLYEERFGDRTVFVLGNERGGLSRQVLDRADSVISIPGTGQVESLNVSASAAVLLSELFRQRRAAPRRAPRRPSGQGGRGRDRR